MNNSIEGIHYQTGKPIKVIIKDGIILEIIELEATESKSLIAPGFVDLQVNGFQGIDFNDSNLEESEIQNVTQTLLENGVTTYFPTVITNSDESIRRSLKTISKACSSNKLVQNTIQGIHLEGPFLSKEEGPRGAHPLEYIQAPNWEKFCAWQEETEGRIELITVSPEWTESNGFIEKCVESGVKVAIGHTAANTSQIEAAVKAGATLSTHLGNAAHLMLPRHPNYLWDQLASEKLWMSIIADGFHLPEAVIKVFMKVKPEYTFLISDSTQFAGLPPGKYQSPIGGEVVLNKYGRLFMEKKPELLAGSASSLLQCVNFLVKHQLATLPEAIEMASIRPLQYINKEKSVGLRRGNKADLLVLDFKATELEILQAVKAGELVYSKKH
ncbi:N-acetylglucosamine-6-phosphate deacetylase [Algoriphagus machipongonensis]|uniref:N-acetylglucosamine-6-phosphate deacetylase n=1 Tax=Algoriphagus machipongonensis TaxID=388413 RepID=A3HY91_9BACT|nr:amidohydrolase family protein [Algoriphagus machipongonensis]EAZ81564.1 N-acetylglucosamine-6-phosphate deacetylase [Algoriphagus machipongonensis]